MKLLVKKGRTSLLVRIFVQDSSSTTGAGLTGLTSASAGLVCYRARDDDGNAGATAITLSAGTRGTWSSGGFVEKDSANMPGVYELGLPDAGQATGSESVTYMLKGATNMAPLALEAQLIAFDPQDAVHLGLSALPNAAASGVGGVAVLDANSLVDVDVKRWLATAVTAATAGIPDVNTKNYNNVAAQTDANSLPKVDVEAINASLAAAQTLKGGLNTVASGTVTTGATSTSIPTSAFSPSGTVSGQFVGRTLIFADNTATAALQGQATTITASTGAALPVLTVNALTTVPSSGDTFFIF